MSETEKTVGRRWGLIAVRGVIGLVILIAVLAGLGASYNFIALRHYRAVSGVPGKLYNVDGYKMHLYCTGHGEPTVLLDAGMGNDSMIWAKVQPELSKTTRVCAYDRAGFGWSDPRPGVRDTNAITSQLHSLLQQAGVTGPIILMGHSIAGIHIREYTTRYPHNVVGLVFVDGSTPLQDQHFPPELLAQEKKVYTLLWLGKWATRLGVLRVMGQCKGIDPGSQSYSAWIKADSCVPEQMAAMKREFSAMQADGEETVNTGPYGNLPILIFSQDPDRPTTQLPPDVSRKLSAIWNGMQDDLKRLSTSSRRIIAKGSTHYVQIDRSELVNREVTSFIQQVRDSLPPSADNGTTKTE